MSSGIRARAGVVATYKHASATSSGFNALAMTSGGRGYGALQDDGRVAQSGEDYCGANAVLLFFLECPVRQARHAVFGRLIRDAGDIGRLYASGR